MRKLKKDEFLEKFKEVHGDKYDYNLSEISTSRTFIKIICPIHGVFIQQTYSHINGCGCMKCSYKERALKKRENILNNKYKIDFSHVILPEGSRIIPLTRGKYTIVDEEDYERLSQYSWYAGGCENAIYAHFKCPNGKFISMHRFLMNPANGMVVDHKDRDKLNNRRSNLRVCTKLQNTFNKAKSTKYKSEANKYIGVICVKNKKSTYWKARIKSNKVTNYLGRFNNEIEAARAYDAKAKELRGEFAYLNFPND